MATNQISSSPYLLSDANQASYRYNGEMPPEQALEEQALNRRQHIANLLIQQGLAGGHQGQMVGRFYVPPSPLQGLGDLAKVAAGAYGTSVNDAARKDLTAKSNNVLTEALRAYQDKTAPSMGPGPQVETAPSNLGDVLADSRLAMPGAPNLRNPQAASPFPAPALQSNPIAPAAYDPPQFGPGPDVMQPASPDQRRQALVDLMASQHPQAQHMGKMLMQQEAMEQQHEDNIGLRREGLAQNAELRKSQIEANALNTQALIDSRERMGQDANDLKNQLADQQAELKRLDIASRKDVANIMADSRRDVQGMKSGPNRPMSATAQKELIQTEEELQGSHQGIEHLKSALAINDKAMGFSGADTLAKAGSLLPDAIRPKSVDATVDLDNLITGSALPQLKAIFGGMPTEGERKILLDVSGSASKTPAQRKAIFERAIQGAENRIKFNTQKAGQLRGGTYFAGDGGLDTTVAPNPVSPIAGGNSSRPQGAKQIGTSGGKPVYQLPDGSKVIAD